MFERAKRNDVIVVAGDENAACSSFIAASNCESCHGRVWRPVAVVAAVQRTHWAVNGDVETDVAAIAEEDERPAGGMDRAIACDQQIGAEQIFVKLQSLLKMS